MSTVALGAGVVPAGKESAVRQALTADIEALEQELIKEAEEDSPDEDEDVPP